MPFDLKVECDTRSELAYDYVTGKNIMGEWSRYPWVEQAGITTAEQLFAHYGKGKSGWELDEMVRFGNQLVENERKYGYKDWYEWRSANWGTPQNAWFDSSYGRKTESTLSFTTAWNPPLGFLEKLFTSFPEHEFEYSWWDTSNSYGREMVIRNAELIKCEPIKRICMHDGCTKEEEKWVQDREWYCAEHAALWQEVHSGFDRDEQLLQEWESMQCSGNANTSTD